MTKFYLPGGEPFSALRRSTLGFLLVLSCTLFSCSRQTSPEPANGLTATPTEKPAAAPEETKPAAETKPANETKPAKKLSGDLEQLRKNIQPEEPVAAVAGKEPEKKPAEVPPEKPEGNTAKPPPPPETVKVPEPAKTAAPPEGIDEKKLLASLKNRMILLGRAFETGNPDEVKKFMIVDADLKAILTSGGYNILGVSLESQNLDAVTQTLKAIKDKKFEHEFVPGKMTFTPNNSIFKKKVPTMSQSKLLLKIDGTPVPFIFYIKQLVWFANDWKVFNAGI